MQVGFGSVWRGVFFVLWCGLRGDGGELVGDKFMLRFGCVCDIGFVRFGLGVWGWGWRGVLLLGGGGCRVCD